MVRSHGQVPYEHMFAKTRAAEQTALSRFSAGLSRFRQPGLWVFGGETDAGSATVRV